MSFPYLVARETPQNYRPEGRRALDGGVDVRAEAGAVVLTLTGFIGADITFDAVNAALRQAAGQPVVIEINSEGGSVFEAVAVHAALRRHGAPVSVQVLGLAASAAFTVALAADPGALAMARGSRMMTHEAAALTFGTSADLATMSELLAGLDADHAALIAARSGMSIQKAAAMMAATTFMSPEQAIALGLVDSILPTDAEPAPQAAHGPRPQSKMELAAALHQAGFARTAAARIAAGGWAALSNELTEIDPQALAATLDRNTAALRAAFQGA